MCTVIQDRRSTAGTLREPMGPRLSPTVQGDWQRQGHCLCLLKIKTFLSNDAKQPGEDLRLGFRRTSIRLCAGKQIPGCPNSGADCHCYRQGEGGRHKNSSHHWLQGLQCEPATMPRYLMSVASGWELCCQEAECLASQSCLQCTAAAAWAIFAYVQVSFFRSNLMLRVVSKPTGKSSDGNPADLEALVKYIR